MSPMEAGSVLERLTPVPLGHGTARRLRIAYQPWSFERLREMAACDIVLPAGVTRCVAPGRVLGANIPLSMLTRDCRASAETPNIRRHVEKLSLRYYAEPVFIG
jgi:L-serine kinase (ATP) / ParB family transcriptional regulator, heme-responsive regulator